MTNLPIQIEIYQSAAGKRPYEDWFNGLRDIKGQARILARLIRVQQGNFGDSKSVGEGVQELRVQYGPGYRVYFAQEGNTLVILLGGSDKSDQKKAIQLAKEAWKDYRSNGDA
jgi:putative addiction module killer protein